VRDIEGRTALVTGASSGLGPVIARRLHREGVKLILTARRRAELDALARELVGSRVVTADLSRRGEAEWLAGAAGEVDILVANAGVGASGPLLDFDVEDIDTALEVNLRAPIVLSRLLLPGMLERGSGHVVLMASMAGQIPARNSSVYSATKFGLRGFGHSVRDELRGTGVGVSLVSPTYVREARGSASSGAGGLDMTVRPDQVAEACLRAIREDRAETTVAPIYARLGGMVGQALPGVATRVRGRMPEIPRG
jgi:short-subunit dehydrogenase